MEIFSSGSDVRLSHSRVRLHEEGPIDLPDLVAKKMIMATFPTGLERCHVYDEACYIDCSSTRVELAFFLLSKWPAAVVYKQLYGQSKHIQPITNRRIMKL